MASFVGMVPASRPQLVILVTVDEPHGAIWGGVVAAPAFSQIAQFDLQYLEVPPDAPATAEVGVAGGTHPNPPPTHGGREGRPRNAHVCVSKLCRFCRERSGGPVGLSG